MQQFYLAPDDEITSVVERLRSTDEHGIVLVVPKGVSLMQSIINVRLLKKKADELGKDLGLVTGDPVCKHLASQVGIKIYASIQDVPKSVPKNTKPTPVIKREPVEPIVIEGEGIGSIKVSHYKSGEEEAEEGQKEPAVAVNDEAEMPSSQVEISSEPSDEGKEFVPMNYPVAEVTDDEPIIEGSNVYLDKEPEERAGSRGEMNKVGVASPSFGLHRPPLKLPRWVKPVSIILIILILAGVVGAGLLLPTASIVIHVPSESVKKSVTIMVDSSATVLAEQTIGGVHHDASVDAQGSAAATGKKNIGNKAKGVITVSNSWSSESQMIAKNSGLISDKGLVFKALTDVTVPGASSSISNGQVVITAGRADLAVEADQPGDQYNVESSKYAIQGLSGDKASKITGVGKGSMTGGSTKELTVIADADILKAKDDAKAKAESSALAGLKSSVPADEIIIEKSINYVTELKDPDHKSGDQADTVLVNASSKASAISTKNSDVQNFVQIAFKDSVPEGKVLRIGTIDFTTWTTTAKSDGIYQIAKEIEGQLVARVNDAEVIKLVQAKSSSSAESLLKEKYAAGNVEIKKSPSWWPLLPVLGSKITVQVTE